MGSAGAIRSSQQNVIAWATWVRQWHIHMFLLLHVLVCFPGCPCGYENEELRSLAAATEGPASEHMEPPVCALWIMMTPKDDIVNR